MNANDLNETVAMLRRKINLIESYADELSARFQTLNKEMESLKTDSVSHGLENRRRSLARQAGFAAIAKDRRKLGISLAAAAAGLFLGGALTKDRTSALDAGMSGFDGVLQGFGESEWAVSLDEDLLIMQKNRIASGRIWVTLQSLLLALEGLKKEAHGGEPLGDVAAIVAKLKESPTELAYLFPVSQWVRVTKSTQETTASE